MSTRSSLKYERNEGKPGFHLYTDFMDSCVGLDVVNLQLDYVAFEASADNTGTCVTLKIPREMAERLGLLQSK